MKKAGALLLIAGIPTAAVLANLVYQWSVAKQIQSNSGQVPQPLVVTKPPRVNGGSEAETSHGLVRSEDVELRIVCSGSQDQTLRTPDYLVQLVNHGSRPVIAPFNTALLKKGTTWFELTDDQGRSIRVDVESKIPADPRSPYLNALIPPKAGYVHIFGSPELVNKITRPEIRSIRFVYAAAEGADYQELAKRTAGGDLLPPSPIYSQTYQLALLK